MKHGDTTAIYIVGRWFTKQAICSIIYKGKTVMGFWPSKTLENKQQQL